MSINAHEMSWLTVEKHARNDIEASRDALEQAGMSVEVAENLRGRIAAMRDILKLADQQSDSSLQTSVDYMQI